MFKLKVLKLGTEIQTLDLETEKHYVIGRGNQCDIVLEEQPGISRLHFKIYFDTNTWLVEVMSKFTSLTKDGEVVQQSFQLQNHDILKLPPYEFIFTSEVQSAQSMPGTTENHNADYISENEISHQASNSSASNSINASNSQKSLAVIDPYQNYQQNNFDDENESTFVGQFNGEPFIRIIDSKTQKEETLELVDGSSWVAGRDETCSIVLNYPAFSRKHFLIEKENSLFFVSDMGSSNGTLLNGSPLQEKITLKSGDIISVGSISVHFELRDPKFKQMLTAVPKDVLHSSPIVIDQAPEMGLQYPPMAVDSNPYAHQQGGALMIQPQNQYSTKYGHAQYQHNAAKKSSASKLIFMGLVGIIAIASLYLFTEKTPEAKVAAQGTTKFSRLPDPQKQLIKHSYDLATNLVLQGKYSLAQAQLQKITEVLGEEAYEDSIKLGEACRTAIEAEAHRQEIELQMKKIAENEQIVNQTLAKCDQVSKTSISESEITICLQDAVERDPSRPQIQEQIDRVRKRIASITQQKEQRQEYESKLKKSQDLFKQAQHLETSGDLLKAITAYEKFVGAPLPDPENKKVYAKRKIASIKQGINTQASTALQAAQRNASSGNLKTAIGDVNRALKIAPGNEQAEAMGRKFRRELNQQLQEIFADATIYEGNSKIDRAMELWKKITEMDTTDGEYYRKARSKIRSYGGT